MPHRWVRTWVLRFAGLVPALCVAASILLAIDEYIGTLESKPWILAVGGLGIGLVVAVVAWARRPLLELIAWDVVEVGYAQPNHARMWQFLTLAALAVFVVSILLSVVAAVSIAETFGTVAVFFGSALMVGVLFFARLLEAWSRLP